MSSSEELREPEELPEELESASDLARELAALRDQAARDPAGPVVQFGNYH
jgi:hypothetical protein